MRIGLISSHSQGRGRVIEAERPDALLPTMGGQTALNLAVCLENGTPIAGIELIEPTSAIQKAEDRLLFKRPWSASASRSAIGNRRR